MLEWTLIRGVMVAFFILANSFFVAAEFALVSIRETRVLQLIAHGRPGARTVLQLKRSLDDFLPAVQFGVTLAALALGWLGELGHLPETGETVVHAGRSFAVVERNGLRISRVRVETLAPEQADAEPGEGTPGSGVEVSV